MNTNRIQLGLLLQTLAIIAGCELGIMFLLPVILSGIGGWVEAGADTLLLTVTAGPLLWWRFSRRFAETRAAPKSGEAASSIRRVRAVGIAGLICVGMLAVGGTVTWEVVLKKSAEKTVLVDQTGRLRMLGQRLAVAAAMHTLEPSPTHERTFDEALEEYGVAAGVLWNRLGSGEADFPRDSEVARFSNDALAAMHRVLAAGQTISEAYDRGRTDRAALDELLAACSVAVERLDAMNKGHAAYDPAGTAAMKLLGRGLGLLLVSALVLVWLLAIGPAVQQAAHAEGALSDAHAHSEAVNADLVALNESHAAFFGCHTTADVARVLTDTLVRNFDAHFARVWLRRSADICGECALAPHCTTKQECLHLIASSGFYTHIDGPHCRVPLGAFKIGLIAQGAGKTISDDVVHDERVHDRQWAAEHGLRSFVGLPLLRDGRAIGVMAMFSRNNLPEHVLETTEILAKVGAAAIANVESIDAQRVATKAAKTAARQDKLTGLPNRALLLYRLQHAIERAERLPEYHFAVMFLDLDRFKIVNDSLGHEFGDRLLQAIAARLRESLRAGDSLSHNAEGTSVARLGGDEFVVLLDGIKKPEDAAMVADRLLKGLAAPYQLGEHEVRSTASIGIVCSNAEYDRADDMLRDADTAMYEAKARGKACFVMFDAGMQTAVQNRLQIENDLRAGIGSDQLYLVYQPIVSLEDGELRGVEALIRWNHPTRGLVMPSEFISIAEETRLILPLSDWIFEQACAQFIKWRQQAPDRAPAYVSVNLSRIHLDTRNLVEQIVRTVQLAGMEPGQLQLEVTESEIMRNRKTAKRILGDLKAAGIRLAVDDFGTGHSSLSCLHEFPFDVLKIDRSFVINLGRGREFIALTNSVVTLAEYLGMTCVAEGVEKRDQIAALQSMGCTCGQGYYFGKPMSAEALIDGEWMGGYLAPAADSLVLSDLTGR